MKRSRSFDRQLYTQWRRSEVSRRAGVLSSSSALAALGGALSLGLATVPGSAQAAPIVINSAQAVTQLLGNGDSLTITPTGSITVPGDHGVQPVAGGSNAIQGISNSGQIDAGLDGVSIFSASRVNGDIANAGTIIGAGWGIAIWDRSSVTGNITNSGSVTGSSWNGISITSSSEVQGSIRNEAGGQIDAAYNGISAWLDSSVGQDIVNDGTIGASSNVGNAGIELLSGSAVSGDVVNGGEIHADGDGINISSGTVGGNLTNTGLIDAGGDGVAARSSTVAGDVANDGTILAAGAGIEISLLSAVGGAIVNTGSVTAGGDAVSVTSSSEVQGNISNPGTLTGALSILGTSGAGDGIDLASTGIIDIGQSESVVSGDLDLTGSDLFAVTLMNFGDYAGAPMTVLGDALIDGALMLDFVSGFSVAAGERFTLFDIGGARGGAFTNYADDDRVGRFDRWVELRIDYTLEGDIDLYSVNVPAPGSLALLGFGAIGWFLRRRRG